MIMKYVVIFLVAGLTTAINFRAVKKTRHIYNRQSGCKDNLQNCHDYGRAVCMDPTYASWVANNCALFCGKCGCKDNLQNCHDYGRAVCMDPTYASWVANNCALFCGKCGCHDNIKNYNGYGCTMNIDPIYDIRLCGCKDNLQNCHDYGRAVCMDPTYASWVANNCALFCGKCGCHDNIKNYNGYGCTMNIDPIYDIRLCGCKDNLQNCHDYGRAVCMDPTYASWVANNCALFCGKCGGGSITLGVGTLVLGGGVVNGGHHGVACVDKIGNCAEYEHERTCTDLKYTEWVKDNCARTCLCSGGSYYTGSYVGPSGSGTSTVSCVDKRGDCATYALQTCIDPKYTEWVKDNCARTCLCSGGSYYTGRYVGPSGTGTVTIAGSHGQVTMTATQVPKKTTTASKTTTSTIGTTASTIGTPASTMGITTSTIGTTTSTMGTTTSTIGTTTSTMGTTTSTMGTTTSTMGTTNTTFGTITTIIGTTTSTMGTTAKKQPCMDDPRLACDKSVCNTDLKIFCQLTCNRCP